MNILQSFCGGAFCDRVTVTVLAVLDSLTVVTNGNEPFGVTAGNRTKVLCKSSKCS